MANKESSPILRAESPTALEESNSNFTSSSIAARMQKMHERSITAASTSSKMSRRMSKTLKIARARSSSDEEPSPQTEFTHRRLSSFPVNSSGLSGDFNIARIGKRASLTFSESDKKELAHSIDDTPNKVSGRRLTVTFGEGKLIPSFSESEESIMQKQSEESMKGRQRASRFSLGSRTLESFKEA